MRFEATPLTGVYLVHPEPVSDDRGWFARTWCRQELEAQGLTGNLVQTNISFNKKRGTLRGMHYQAAPHTEAKMIRVVRGALFDVALDLRPESPTFKKWVGYELRGSELRMLYLPKGIAHGFQTLEDDTEIFYQISAFYHAESARGVRWDDPEFGIKWPLPRDPIMSERDRNFALWKGERGM